MCHIRTMQKLAPSLQKKIDKYQGDLICSPRNLYPQFHEVAKEERRLKIKETQSFVQENINILEQIMKNIHLQKTHQLNNAFYLTSMEAVSFREMIQQCKEE